MTRRVPLVWLAVFGLAACNGGVESGASAVPVASTTTTTTTTPAVETAAPPVATAEPATSAPDATVAPATVAPATVAPCRVPETGDIVQRGDCGSTVVFIQDRLIQLGFTVASDGLFGPGTETAVKNFQSSRGLVADGIVGPLTWTKLFEGGVGD